MNEMSKSTERRKNKNFPIAYQTYSSYFKGVGLDIGCGNDVMQPWPETERIDGFDLNLGSGNAQYLRDIADNTYDFVVSSHCLEHMTKPEVALLHWIRVTKPGGHLVITVPDWEMYEHKLWPSRGNGDHKTSWTTGARPDKSDYHQMFLPGFLLDFDVEIIDLQRVTDNFDPTLPDSIDQTLGIAECAIEFILKKR